MHLKRDELIRTVNGAHNALLNLEELTEPTWTVCDYATSYLGEQRGIPDTPAA